MSLSKSSFAELALMLVFSASLVAGCSSSSSDDGQAPADTNIEGNPANTPTDTPTNNPTVTDPLVPISTRVSFNITVPAYMSDALQVRVTWGDKDIAADWVGDELWSAIDDFPTNTQNPLVVTFYDNNGAIVLGSVEQSFGTETNDMQIVSITADQFDTDKWDSDSDGVSNLDELIAGTEPFGSARILLFNETQDFRHDSIPSALVALETLADSVGIQTERADDSLGVFTDENLAKYDAVIWVLTSGDVLNTDEQAVFERYIQSGRGYAGIHAASDTEYDWPWYGNLVGAYFERHPVIQPATIDVEDATHASTIHLGLRWTRTDEWYDFSNNPRAQVNVLLSLDESSYSGGGMGGDHPIAWYHNFDGGRAWYTGGGHTEASYSEPDFRAHLLGGLRYAAGLDNP